MILFTIKHTFYRFFLTLVNLRYYVFHRRLLLIDTFIFLIDLFLIPFKLLRFTSDDYTGSMIYGEISYYGLSKILQKCELKSNATFLDIGSGKGKAVFFARLMFHLSSTGIEINARYICISQLLKQILFISKTSFKKESFTQYPLPNCSVYLIVGTTFDESDLNKLIITLEQKDHEFFIISVSEPLNSQFFYIVSSFYVPCSWGFSQVFIQRKKPSSTVLL